jgi:AraC family transcriptional regulator
LLAVHLLRQYTQAEPLPALVSPTAELRGLKLQQLKDYIDAHLGEELSLATLAAQIPMSQFHFARAFKAAVGVSPHQFILGLKRCRA